SHQSVRSQQARGVSFYRNERAIDESHDRRLTVDRNDDSDASLAAECQRVVDSMVRQLAAASESDRSRLDRGDCDLCDPYDLVVYDAVTYCDDDLPSEGFRRANPRSV